ncbi:hypothetical protein GQ607_000738 [Colletotrichum asianum]|uniref:Uncharacterized protein n=1 Tax=Colletotrichum asianum TaxID=702518 RepID=A0A8H3ZXY2_9PEZI|nr:hypothetical protein GQ607_000738 [Colletotrichum asianum]
MAWGINLGAGVCCFFSSASWTLVDGLDSMDWTLGHKFLGVDFGGV